MTSVHQQRQQPFSVFSSYICSYSSCRHTTKHIGGYRGEDLVGRVRFLEPIRPVFSSYSIIFEFFIFRQTIQRFSTDLLCV